MISIVSDESPWSPRGGSRAGPGEVGRQVLAGFDASSVRAVLHAACSSPSAVHHLPILADLLIRSYAFPPQGARRASPDDLSRWINAVRAEVPGVTAKDDWIPCDPRLLVLTRVGERRRPLHPGLLSRPQDLLPTVLEYAECIDPVLLDSLGFGLSDVAELAMRTMEVERAILSPHWTSQRPTDPADPARVTAEEVQAAERLLAGWVDHTNNDALPAALQVASDKPMEPERHERLVAALAWATREAAELASHQRGWLLRGALFVRHNMQVAPAPGGVVLDSLSAATLALLKHAAAARKPAKRRAPQPDYHGTEPAERLRGIARGKVVSSLLGLPAHVIIGAITDTGDEITAVVAPGSRHVVAIQVIADTDPQTLPRKIDRAHKQLRRVRPGSTLQLPAGVTAEEAWPAVPQDLLFETAATTPAGIRTIRSDVQVRRVTLVAGPWPQPRLRRRGVVTMTVDDWRDLTARSGDDPEEFWAFLDELAELPCLRAVEAFDLRDLWSVFHETGLLYRGGNEVAGLAVLPRDCTAEWRDAALSDGVDETLHRLDLPALRDWPNRSPVRDGVVTVGSLQLTRHVLVNATPALAVGADPGDGEDFQPSLVFTLAEAVRAGVAQLSAWSAEPDSHAVASAGWVAWQTATDGDAVLIELIATSEPGDRGAIWFAGLAPKAFLIAYHQGRFTGLGTQEVHDLIGNALSDAVAARVAISASVEKIEPGIIDSRILLTGAAQAAEAALSFARAWRELPPTFRIGHFHTVAFAPTGGPGSRVSLPARHRAERRLAQALHDVAVPTQQVSGADATRLLTTTVCPAALNILIRDLAQFEPATALSVVACEVERVWAERSRTQTQRAALQVSGWKQAGTDGDPIEETITCRAADLVIEAMLHTPPRGTAMLDHRDWERLLLEAALCLDLSGRATSSAVELDEVVVGIDDTGLCLVGSLGSRMDMLRYHDARLAIHQEHEAQRLHTADDLRTDGSPDRQADSSRTKTWTAMLRDVLADPQHPPYERPVANAALVADQAMREHMRTGIDEVSAVLTVVASWSTAAGKGEIVHVDRDHVVREVTDWTGLDADAVDAAIDLLTLTPALLAEEGLSYWELERRSGRLATRPLVAPDGTAGQRRLLLLPRRVAATQQLFANYTVGGRLPWPPQSLPPAVAAAYDDWQQARRRAFEFLLEEIVRGCGFTHYKRGLREKPAAKLGLYISGEIDLLLADEHRRRLWVIEAKDPQVPFGLSQILYEVTTFHGIEPDRTSARQATFKTPGRSYVGKLLKKADDVQEQLTTVLRLFGINDDPNLWHVIPLFVTPNPVAAAFVAQPAVTFTCPGPLPAILTAADLPASGYTADASSSDLD